MTNRVKWATPPMPGTSDQAPVYTDADELAALMSLALDDLLDEADAARMDWLLAADADGEATWQTWQAMDATLRHAPMLEPSQDFVLGLERRVVEMERRRRLRSGVIVGLLALLLWGSALVGTVSLGAFVLANQATWLNGLIHSVTLGWVRFISLAQMAWSGLVGLASSPQALALGVCYALLAALLLGLWIGFLRRTTRAYEPVSA